MRVSIFVLQIKGRLPPTFVGAGLRPVSNGLDRIAMTDIAKRVPNARSEYDGANCRAPYG